MSRYHRENPDAPISHDWLEGVHVGTDPVTGEQQFLVEVNIQPQLPTNGFTLKAEDIHDDLQIDCDDYSGDG